MRRLFCSASFAAVFAAAALAQGTTQDQTQPRQARPSVLTVTGCLRAGAESDTFVLSDLKWGEPATSPAGTTGTTGGSTTAPPPPPPPAATLLKLASPPTGVRLSEHVGHKVEVTGTLIDEHEPAAALGDGSARTAARTGSGGDQTQREQEARAHARAEHTLDVRTIRMVADKCDQ